MSNHAPPDLGFLGRLMRAGDGEDGHTELFAELLRSPQLQATFLRDVVKLGSEWPLIGKLRVESQPETASEKGVPDLQLLGEGVNIVIENKFGAPLTDNQPHEYLRSLIAWRQRNPTGLATLVLQAPERRRCFLEQESAARIRASLGDSESNEHSGVLFRIVSWEQTVRALSYAEVADPVVAYIRDAFAALVPQDLAMVPTSIPAEGLTMLNTPQVQSTIVGLEDLLGLMWKQLSQDKSLELKMYSFKGDFTSQGFTLHPDTERELWVGLSFRAAAAATCSPLMVQLVGSAYDTRALDVLRRDGMTALDGEFDKQFDWVDRPVIALPLVGDLDPPSQASAVVAVLKQMLSAATTSAPTGEVDDGEDDGARDELLSAREDSPTDESEFFVRLTDRPDGSALAETARSVLSAARNARLDVRWTPSGFSLYSGNGPEGLGLLGIELHDTYVHVGVRRWHESEKKNARVDSLLAEVMAPKTSRLSQKGLSRSVRLPDLRGKEVALVAGLTRIAKT